MSNIDKRITELGFRLPSPPVALASYVPAKRVGNLIYTSGQLPFVDGKLTDLGLLGKNVEIDIAKKAAGICVLNALAVIKDLVGDLDQIKQIVKVVGFVACDANFDKHSLVVNGASDFLLEVFGDKGKHARSAIGVSSLPLNSCVEVELIVEI